MNEITVVLPTIRYTKYLDKAIESCLNLKYVKANLYVNINSTSKDFEQSKFWNDERIKWRYVDKFFPNPTDSFNDAIEHSEGDFIFILSDDDIIRSNFLEGVNLDEFNEKTLYATRIDIIDADDNITRTNPAYPKKEYRAEEVSGLFFTNILHHHLSLFLFHRKMYETIGKFRMAGYPNGFYGDTVFNGKLLANCDRVVTADNVVFSRRESTTQDSAKFYFDNVNDYFNIITDLFFEDDNFRKEAIKRYNSRENFRRILIKRRFLTEWSKLNKKIYNKSSLTKVKFLYKFFSQWDTGLRFKFATLCFMPVSSLILHLPQNFKSKLKAIIGL